MKVTMTIQPTSGFDTIRFFDACKAATDKLMAIAQTVLDNDDLENFLNTEHEVLEVDGDEAEVIGKIKIKE